MLISLAVAKKTSHDNSNSFSFLEQPLLLRALLRRLIWSPSRLLWGFQTPEDLLPRVFTSGRSHGAASIALYFFLRFDTGSLKSTGSSLIWIIIRMQDKSWWNSTATLGLKSRLTLEDCRLEACSQRPPQTDPRKSECSPTPPCWKCPPEFFDVHPPDVRVKFLDAHF